MVAPVNRLASPPAKVRRVEVLDDTAFDTVVALGKLLDNDDPKVVLSAAKLILEFEKARVRKEKQPRPSEPAEERAFTPEPLAVEPELIPDPPREPDAVPQPLFDRAAPCPLAGGGGRLRGIVEPSISSFLPPRITGSPTCPRPTPTPPSSPTPPS